MLQLEVRDSYCLYVCMCIPRMHTNISTPVPTPPFTPNWKLKEYQACSDGIGTGNGSLCRVVQGARNTIPTETAER